MNWRRIGIFSAVFAVLGMVVALATGYRAANLYSNALDFRHDVKYLIETGGNIGQTSADTALSSTYLEIIFGDNPELLEQIQSAVDRGTANMPDVREGDISAIIVTYRMNGDEKIENVVAHIMGGFPLGKRKISMHRDGFFASQINRQLWSTGDSALKFLGRDLVIWANSDEDQNRQQKIIDAIFTGEIFDLAADISEKPLYYTAVFPSPRQIVPSKMRNHIKAILVKGYLSPDEGSIEVVLLTNGDRSTALVASMAEDVRMGLLIALRTRFRGVKIDNPWPPANPQEYEAGNWNREYIPVWWAYEMASTLEKATFARKDLTVSISATYGRRMVNASLKTIERFGRDYSQIKGVKEGKLDPRLVDANLRTPSPLHYWSRKHRWGPDWPFGTGTNALFRESSEEEQPLDSAPPVTETL